MCGRYYYDKETAERCRAAVLKYQEKYDKEMTFGDIAPAMESTVIVRDDVADDLKLEQMRWGFPMRDSSQLIINARAESALTKKTFMGRIMSSRCIVPAKHFYEWDSDKNKAAFSREDASILYMLGFFGLFSCGNCFTILTTEANASVSKVHSRMPIFIEENQIRAWILDDSAVRYFLELRPSELVRYQKYEQMRWF